MKRRWILAFLLLVCSVVSAQGEAVAKLESYPKENVHLFLLAGQSNMAGRGVVTDECKKIHPRVFALSKNGQWVPAVDPIHYDKSAAGAGLAKSFAVSLAEEDESIVIGLVPAACGGSSILKWQPGVYYEPTKSHPYDDAISRAKRAMEDGVLKGILWHQGEADCNPERSGKHEERLIELIGRFRKDLGVEDLPFVMGELGRYYNKSPEDKEKVNQAFIDITEKVPFTGFVSSEGLTSNPDHIHFNTESLKIFGERYAKVYEGMCKSEDVFR